MTPALWIEGGALLLAAAMLLRIHWLHRAIEQRDRDLDALTWALRQERKLNHQTLHREGRAHRELT